ncbi:MAG TPA: MFS transporter [Pseudomonadales bacterium]|nr:MFS transporter [Pseudomonadales bacterium]
MQEVSLAYARRALLVSLVSQGMGFTVLFPVLAPLGRQIGLTEIQITTVIACSSVTMFFAAPIWGRTSDRWGRKRVLLIGLFGFTLGTVLFNSVLYAGLLSVLTGSALFGALVAARVTHAGMMSATMPSSNAYMADITDAANRTKGMGAAGAANNIGSILGPAVAGLAVYSMMLPLWVMAAVAFLNGLFVWRVLPEPPRHVAPSRTPRMKYTDRRILPFVIVGVLMFSGNALVQQTMGFRIQDTLHLSGGETARTFGITMMFSAAASLIAQTLIVQRLTVAPFTLLRIAMPILIVAFSIMAVAESQAWLTIAMTVLGFGMGLAGPGFQAGASLAVSPREQGAVAGVAGSCGPLGFALGPLLGGVLYRLNPALPYASAAVMFAALFVAMFWLARRVTQHSEHTG